VTIAADHPARGGRGEG